MITESSHPAIVKSMGMGAWLRIHNNTAFHCYGWFRENNHISFVIGVGDVLINQLFPGILCDVFNIKL